MTDSSILKDNRKLTYLNAEGADKPLLSPVADDVLQRARLSPEPTAGAVG